MGFKKVDHLATLVFQPQITTTYINQSREGLAYWPISIHHNPPTEFLSATCLTSVGISVSDP